jgi:hypothetical protein
LPTAIILLSFIAIASAKGVRVCSKNAGIIKTFSLGGNHSGKNNQ